ncbi:MAG TPA: RNA polymerase subunit sigma-70 [Solirubrobacteraceae bacterium]|nr:RNA polymerase subunit sigma-70 [Solirubrobacteraceae bacterium]
MPKSSDVIDRARAGDEQAFAALTDPLRRELQLHCYRMLGSLHDAEDLLQETLIAAWRGLPDFQRRSSLRSWLYTIATNRCLNAIRDAGRRPAAAEVPAVRGNARAENHAEVSWLEPYPDALIDAVADAAPGPEARYETKEAVALAFISGLQHLGARQRAVLVLRDVLGFRADEVAEMLGSSPASVNSALQRARSSLEARDLGSGRAERISAAAAQSELVARFAAAFEADDIDAVVALLTEDAVVSMPPEPEWHTGREAVGRFLLQRHLRRQEPWRFAPARANGQPAFAYYLRRDGGWRRAGMFVIAARADGIASITRFHDFARMDLFGAPAQL